MIEILAVSTDQTDCGIAEYLGYLRRHLSSDFVVRCDPAWLDPQRFFADLPSLQEYQGPQVVWLNYHAALHSRWTPLQVCQLRIHGVPVMITYHDTGVPNSEQCKGLYDIMLPALNAAPARFIVHEPCADLPEAIYLRQGVPDWQPPFEWDRRALTYTYASVEPDDQHPYWLGRGNRPILGTVGFPFPWKNYDLLAEATHLAGWSLLLMAPRSTDMQVEEWKARNPWTAVVREFLPASQVVSNLGACDATAFLYMCANTGTSGAIRQGIAARKPVLATGGCRQFRDLADDEWGNEAIRWLEDLSRHGVAEALTQIHLSKLDSRIHRIAERDSWRNQALKYAQVFRSLAGQEAPV